MEIKMSEQDFITIGTKTPMQEFLRRLSEVEQKFVNEHKPYDAACAKLEFRDKLEQAEKESERRNGYVKFDEIKIDIKDLEKYGNLDRFEVEAIDDDVETQKITTGGTIERKNVVVGKTVRYRCKTRGHGISVAMTMDEYNEMFPKKKLKENKE